MNWGSGGWGGMDLITRVGVGVGVVYMTLEGGSYKSL